MDDERERRYRRLAFEFGGAVKWDVPVNAIERSAQGILGIAAANTYEVEGITSVRAQHVYNWVMTLLEAPMEPEEADRRLRDFICDLLLADSEERPTLLRLLGAGPAGTAAAAPLDLTDLHPRIRQAAEALCTDGHHGQAVFEALKALENMVKEKSGLTDEIGQALMFRAFSADGPLLLLGDLSSQEGRDRQDGFKFMLGDAMRGIWNIAGHGDLDIGQVEAIEHLAFASLLARVVETAEVP